MRPISLIMEAFGPFSGVETINFDVFKDKNIFLITGPTGAGKTTIFDALIFALYGVSSGGYRDAESFRSDHAKVDLLTAVTLTFELRGKTYKVKRIPKQMRPKLSGDGLTVQNADAELTGEGILLSGVSDVTDKINSLFGLNAEQFRQIMMIPQGEFRRLILSNSNEKSEIFRKLFGTSIFERMQEQMKLEEDVLKNQYLELNTQIRALIGQLSADEKLANQRDVCFENPVIPNLKKLLEMMSELSGEIEDENKHLKLKVDEHEKRLDQIKLQISEQKQLKVQKEALLKMIASLEAHLLGEAEIEAVKKKLKEAEKAASMRAEAQNIKEKEASLAERVKLLNTLDDAIGLQEIAFETCKSDYEGISSLNASLESSKKAMISLQLISDDVKHFAEDKVKFSQLQNQIDGFQMEKTKLMDLIDQDKLREGELSDQLNALQISKLDFEKLVSKRKELRYLETALKEAIENNQSLNEKKRQLHKQENESQLKLDALNQARSESEILEKKFMEGYSGLLAKSLEEGQSCPVCGSKTHPMPAVEVDVVTKEALDASRVKLEKCQTDFEKSKIEIQNLERQIEEAQQKQQKTKMDLVSQYQTIMDVKIEFESEFPTFQSELKAYIQEVNRKGNALKDALGNESEVQKGLNETKDNLNNRVERLKAMEEKLGIASVEREGLKIKIEQISKKVPEDYQDHKRLLEEMNALEQNIKALSTQIKTITEAFQSQRESLNLLVEKKKVALEEHHVATNKFKEADRQFNEALALNGFETEAQFNQVNLSKDEFEDLHNQSTGFDKKKQELENQIENQKRMLANKELIDLDFLDQSLLEEGEALTQHRQKLNQNVSMLTQNKRLAEALELIMKESEKVITRNAYVTKLSKMARGQNAQKLSFENFVLSQYFEDVLSAANLRLYKMTTGRFELVRKKERGKGNSQSGLDIEVMDQYTGKLRHVKTLSGGETFKASLALALGLSDIVQRFSGGISLETMFIDEGFGTLDSDSLDKAIESLMSLGGKSRLVGIISHVQELKERIPSQLQVLQQIEGSHTRVQY